MSKMFSTALTSLAMLAVAASSHAAVVITEVHPTGSSTTTYAADWFEITNTGSTAETLTGWVVDDNSNTFAAGGVLNGVTTLGAGQSAVFLELGTGTNAPTSATLISNFTSAWFTTPPANLLVGYYSASNIGLSSSGDGVNVFNAAGVAQASVTFGAATTAVTFDNGAGVNNAAISTLSVSGTNGAFNSVSGGEVGSPGTAPVPEPASLGVILTGALGLMARRRRA